MLSWLPNKHTATFSTNHYLPPHPPIPGLVENINDLENENFGHCSEIFEDHESVPKSLKYLKSWENTGEVTVQACVAYCPDSSNNLEKS